MLRKILPPSFKLALRVTQRKIADKNSGVNKQFCKPESQANTTALKTVKTISQPIYYNPLSANKVTNIQLAIKEISTYAIQPGHLFSFWDILGKPTAKKGYQTGRNIIGNTLKEDIGGGLCQVAGMLYHLALETGMEIVERHNHTLDLYEEDKRYTPLGADASVVYGYKDLRFKNPHDTTVFMAFDVSQEQFNGQFLAEKDLPPYVIRFERAEAETKRTIKTYRKTDNSAEEFLNLSAYKI